MLIHSNFVNVIGIYADATLSSDLSIRLFIAEIDRILGTCGNSFH